MTKTQRTARSEEYMSRFNAEVYSRCNLDAADGASDSFVVLAKKLWADCTRNAGGN